MAAPAHAGLEALAASGVPALTGWPDSAPVLPPLGFQKRLDALSVRIAVRTTELGEPVRLNWGRVLTGRAGLLGLSRSGTCSANGACRLVQTRDGWVAISLARPDDWEAVPALLAPAGTAPGDVDPADPWPAVIAAARRVRSVILERQGVLLGMPVGVLRSPAAVAGPVGAEQRWSPRSRPLQSLREVEVIDLSAMWAGPLATRILAAAGASVTKVELSGRPDGSRGVPAFYRWLHRSGQPEELVDPATGAGRERLRALLAAADVVVESARPRALAQLGVGPDDLPGRPGRVWLAVTGHGRGAGAARVGFGDDAAAAGGLVGWSAVGQPVFLADAVADPVTGMVAAAALLDALGAGGGVLLDVSLSGVAAWLARGPGWGTPAASPVVRRAPGGGWLLDDGTTTAVVRAPVAGPLVPELTRQP